MKPILHALAVAVLVLSAIGAMAQTAPVPQNIYAGGLSYAVSGSSPVAGTGLYGRTITDSTIAFTVFDAVPNTLKPLTVTSNVGIGIAQKALTLGKVDIFVPTAAGISWTGSNTGFQWNTGGLAVFNYKGLKLMPNLRVFKSSVSNGTGYQLIPGFLVGKQF